LAPPAHILGYSSAPVLHANFVELPRVRCEPEPDGFPHRDNPRAGGGLQGIVGDRRLPEGEIDGPRARHQQQKVEPDAEALVDLQVVPFADSLRRPFQHPAARLLCGLLALAGGILTALYGTLGVAFGRLPEHLIGVTLAVALVWLACGLLFPF